MALVDYASSDEADEDEEDVQTKPSKALVDYSSSDHSGEPLKRKRDDNDDNDTSSELPPLPSKFHDLYASTARLSTKDDPSLHGGRKRVTPHVEGNWPTHLYIEWYPSTAEHESLSTLISTLKETTAKKGAKLHSFLTSDLGASLPLHISLSRPIGFSTEQKDVFLSSLEHALKSSGIRPFNVLFSGLDWVPNFEKTRWFLVLRLNVVDENQHSNGLNKLLFVCNKTVQAYGQSPLYAKATTTMKSQIPRKHRTTPNRPRSEPKLDRSGMEDLSQACHISIAWTLEPPSHDLLEATKAMTGSELEDIGKIAVKVKEIKAKIGNVVTNILLHKNMVEGKDLFGF